jgi:hypothetical protein
MLGEYPKGILEAQSEQQIDDDVLEKDDRSAQTLKHLHLGVDQKRREALDVLLGNRTSAAYCSIHQALVGEKTSHGTQHAVLSDGVCVLMSVRHTGVEEIIRISLRIGANVIADQRNAVMRRTHKGSDTLGVRCVENVDYRAYVLKTQCLSASLLLRHVINAEELVVAKQQSIHHEHLQICGDERRDMGSR